MGGGQVAVDRESIWLDETCKYSRTMLHGVHVVHDGHRMAWACPFAPLVASTNNLTHRDFVITMRCMGTVRRCRRTLSFLTVSIKFAQTIVSSAPLFSWYSRRCELPNYGGFRMRGSIPSARS